jgi:hypothetical protein
MNKDTTLSKLVDGIFRRKIGEIEDKALFCESHRFVEEARWLENQRFAINSVQWAVTKAIEEYEEKAKGGGE